MSTVARKAVVADVGDRKKKKKKKAKVRVAVAPNPTRCYNISIQVVKRGVPVAGAVLKIQSLNGGKWRKANAPVATDANGSFVITGGGLHKIPGGAASNSKIRVKYKNSYSRTFRAPCAQL